MFVEFRSQVLKWGDRSKTWQFQNETHCRYGPPNSVPQICISPLIRKAKSRAPFLRPFFPVLTVVVFISEGRADESWQPCN
jgi:hypothetical protein